MPKGKKGRGRRKPAVRTIYQAPDRVEPTPETKRKLCKPSLERWKEAGQLPSSMEQAANEIERVFRAKTMKLWVSQQKWERTSPGTGEPLAEHILIADRDHYTPWANRLSRRWKQGGPPALETVIDIVIDGHIASDIDRARRWRHGTTKVIVRRALLEYAVMAGWAPVSDLTRFDATAA